MAESHLRQLERRFRESGDLGDEVAWLTARRRAGELGSDRLELAVYLGSRAAAQLVVDPPARTRAPKSGVRGFVRKLEPWGSLPCLRAAIAATRLLVPADEEPDDEDELESLHLAEAYAIEQTPELEATIRALPNRPRTFDPRWQATRLCAFVARLAPLESNNLWAWKAKNTTEVVSEALPQRGAAAERVVRAAITAELLPWTLGYGDPVRERVEARQGQAE